ncbi:TRAP transporter substrate-binding protein DctP [Geobacillus zalihae]|uniref:TRAP transporter substrate-binding protein DctP n=1 Tax=Geobacillus zalihae TaxID=213419 RepID=UPI00262F534E|nr:TRAP transporter substrate-binding protein DctP [Geobacillus zalihae]WKA48064.1 TRAP transporter substrate-binding protein DctP [Geobacillus zalihae]
MRKRALFVGALLTASILLSACGKSSSTAEPQPNKGEENGYEPVTIRLAYNLPQDHHISIGVENFAKTVTEKSGGKVKIQVYPAGQLLSDKEMNQAILTGGVEMGVNSSTLWASTVPAMGIFDVPYAFPNHETAGKALSGELREKLNKAMEEKGGKSSHVCRLWLCTICQQRQTA